MEKIKILYLITKGNWGGAQRYVYDLATRLPTDQFEAIVASGAGTELPERLAAAGIRAVRLGAADRNLNARADGQTLFDLIRLIRRETPDIIHLNSPKIGGLGAVAARLIKPRAKIIYTAHGWPFHEQRPWWQRTLIKFFSWLTILLADQVIVISQSEFTAVVNWPGVRRKLVQIYNGIEAPTLLAREVAREELAKKLKTTFPPNTLLIGTIAELHPNKGLQYAIAAMEQLRATQPTAKLIIIGGGEDKTKLERDVITRGLSQQVFLTGHLDQAGKYLPGLDVFVLPSVKEGLPYVLLEAGLAGLPVVATQVGGVPEIILDQQTGLVVTPGNSTALAEALSEVLKNSEKRQNLGVRLKQHVEQRFSLNHMLSATLAIYAKPISSLSKASR